MAWFKVDDGFHASRKLLMIHKRARFGAAGLWAIAGSWCGDQLTDGFVPDYIITQFGAPPSAPQALVDSGLWERTQGGYVFYKWGEYQPSKEDVDADRAASRERMANLRARRKQEKQPEQRDAEGAFGRTVTNSSESVRNPVPSRPDPLTEAKASVPRKRAQRITEEFEVTTEMIAWARAKVPLVDGRLETEKFINYWMAKSGKDAAKHDWVSTWRNWMLTASQSTGRPPTVKQSPADRFAANMALVNGPLDGLLGIGEMP